MHHHTELSFIDEFRWVSTLYYLKNGRQNAVLPWFMLQAGPPALQYYCVVVLHSCILLTPVGHSSNREYHCCLLTRQSSCVSNFYRTFNVFIWLSLHLTLPRTSSVYCYILFFNVSLLRHFICLYPCCCLYSISFMSVSISICLLRTLKHFQLS